MSHERMLVVGSNCFSGSHFVAHCLEQGLKVTGISRSPEPDPCFLPYRWITTEGFSFHQLDLNKDLDDIMEVVSDSRPDYVVNFAAQGMVAQSWSKPEDWFMTNTVSMINFHDRLRHCSFIKKFVQASTPEVYGSTSQTIREDHAYSPSTPYAISKAACDLSLLAFVRTYGFPAVLTRAANVCGPGQQLYRIIPRTLFCALTSGQLRLDGGGTSTRAFLDIRDVCEITLRIARQAEPGQIFHLSSDEWVTIRSLVEQICTRVGVDFDSIVEVGPPRLGQDAAYLLDSSLVKNQFGWSPKRDLAQILADTHQWMTEHLESLREQEQSYIHKP